MAQHQRQHVRVDCTQHCLPFSRLIVEITMKFHVVTNVGKF